MHRRTADGSAAGDPVVTDRRQDGTDIEQARTAAAGTVAQAAGGRPAERPAKESGRKADIHLMTTAFDVVEPVRSGNFQGARKQDAWRERFSLAQRLRFHLRGVLRTLKPLPMNGPLPRATER